MRAAYYSIRQTRLTHLTPRGTAFRWLGKSIISCVVRGGESDKTTTQRTLREGMHALHLYVEQLGCLELSLAEERLRETAAGVLPGSMNLTETGLNVR